MKRSQIIIIASASVCLLLCAGAAWFLFDALAGAEKAKAERDAKDASLAQIYRTSPFPNEANVGQVKRDLATISDWTKSIRETLRAGNMDPQPLQPNEFYLKLQNMVRELPAISPVPGQSVVPAGFAFGFERYLGGASSMPDREHTPRLTRQLAIVEALSQELLKKDIQQLTQFSREVFEDGQAARVAPAPPRTSAAAPAGPLEIATKERFTIRFTARQNGVQEILNTLATSPLFVTVTSVSLAKSTPEDVLQPDPALVAQVKSQAQLKPGEAAWPPDVQRIVAGPDVAPMLEVVIEFDVLTFNPPQA